MQVVYATEPFPQRFSKSVFLAGPTPRRADVASWRPAAIEALAAAGFDGVVFNPERRHAWADDYTDQIEWETTGFRLADAALFWVPRELGTMPAFTTNVEFGLWAASGKAVFGGPPDAAKNRYLIATARRLGVPVFDTLADTVGSALAIVGAGVERGGGERFVPSPIWRHPTWQAWYAALREAGNELVGADLEWSTAEVCHDAPWLFVVRTRIRVGAEDRVKSGELVVGRPDASAVVAYTKGSGRLVCVREFRSACTTGGGHVLELPSGSSTTEADPAKVAASELAEETGLIVDAGRLVPHGHRQVASTLLAHRLHLFSVELTEAEMDDVDARGGETFGLTGDGERTTVVVCLIEEFVTDPGVDWSMAGMVRHVTGPLKLS